MSASFGAAAPAARSRAARRPAFRACGCSRGSVSATGSSTARPRLHAALADGSKKPIASISSPKNSMRTGCSCAGGNKRRRCRRARRNCPTPSTTITAAVARLRQAEDQLLGRDRRVGCDGQAQARSSSGGIVRRQSASQVVMTVVGAVKARIEQLPRRRCSPPARDRRRRVECQITAGQQRIFLVEEGRSSSCSGVRPSRLDRRSAPDAAAHSCSAAISATD